MLANRALSSRHFPTSVVFDGSYLQRTSALSGVTDSKLGTVSCWLKPGADGSSEIALNGRPLIAAGEGAFIFGKTSSNKISVTSSYAGSNVVAMRLLSGATITQANGWQHVVASWDVSDTNKRHLYLNGSDDLNVDTWNDATLDNTHDTWEVGRDTFFTSNIWQDQIADLMWWPGAYVDLSDAANLAAFYLSGPVPASRAIDILGTPAVQFSGPWTGWKTNKGSGGAFTESGTLTQGVFTY